MKKKKVNTWRRFTPEEDQFILDNYLKIPMKQISRILGRSSNGAGQRLKALGYKVPKEIAQKFARESQIKPGTAPFNKGKKVSEYMSEEAITRMKAHSYQKGNIPHNAFKHDGVITTRKDNRGVPYRWLRIGLGKWIPLHIYIWEKENGRSSKGHCVIFKDGNTLNCDPKNLELITMAENAIRNSGTVNLPDRMVAHYMATTSYKTDEELKEALLKHPELIELKRNQLLLNREIRKQNDKKSN